MSSAWRIAAFLAGLISVWAVAGSPLATMDHHLLTAHMAQHLLLMTVAAPLMLLGAPAVAPPPGSSFQVVRIVIHPLFGWLASTATVIGWHIPALFELGMYSKRVHEFEQASFLAAGLLFWLPVVQPWPSLARWPQWSVPLYLFLATLPCDALSAFLTFCNRVVYPHYGSASALGDQECAGALMWVWVTIAYLVPAAVVTIQMLSPERRGKPLPFCRSHQV
jgi:putative membrane protein